MLVTTDINHAEELCDGPDLTIATLPKSGKIVFLQVIHMVNIVICKSSHFFIIISITEFIATLLDLVNHLIYFNCGADGCMYMCD